MIIIIHLDNFEELGLEAVLDLALEHVGDVGVLEVLLHVHDVRRAQVAALLVPGLRPERRHMWCSIFMPQITISQIFHQEDTSIYLNLIIITSLTYAACW